MTIYEVKISVQKDGVRYVINKHEAEETKAAYKFHGRLIKKSLFGQIDTKFYNNRGFVAYSTWSLPENVEAEKIKLMGKCTSQIEAIYNDAVKLKQGLNIYLGQKVFE